MITLDEGEDCPHDQGAEPTPEGALHIEEKFRTIGLFGDLPFRSCIGISKRT